MAAFTASRIFSFEFVVGTREFFTTLYSLASEDEKCVFFQNFSFPNFRLRFAAICEDLPFAFFIAFVFKDNAINKVIQKNKTAFMHSFAVSVRILRN